jgi:SAM-dependent methyltransferase
MIQTSCPICGEIKKKHFLKVKDHKEEAEFNLVQCLSCQLVSLENFPDKELLDKYYSDDYHYKVKEDGLVGFMENNLNRAMHKKHLRIIEKYVKTGKILDLGCGSGYFLTLAKEKKWIPFGVEMSEYASQFAKKRSIPIINKIITEVTFPKEEFDVISMFNVLEHMNELNTVLKKNHRWLKKDGILVVEVPNLDSFQMKVFKEKWIHLDVPRHIFHFKKKSFNKLVQKNGFKIIKEYSLPFSSHEVAGWLHSLKQSIIRKNKKKVIELKKEIESDEMKKKKSLSIKILMVVLISQILRLFPEFLNIKPGVKTYILKKV